MQCFRRSAHNLELWIYKLNFRYNPHQVGQILQHYNQKRNRLYFYKSLLRNQFACYRRIKLTKSNYRELQGSCFFFSLFPFCRHKFSCNLCYIITNKRALTSCNSLIIEIPSFPQWHGWKVVLFAFCVQLIKFDIVNLCAIKNEHFWVYVQFFEFTCIFFEIMHASFDFSISRSQL